MFFIYKLFNKRQSKKLYLLTFFTDGLRIADESCQAHTDGTMILYSTFCVSSACVTVARILALFIDTGQLRWTFRINRTLRFWS